MGRQITSIRSQADAGYFRIGPLVLNVPPEQIQCHKVINNQEVLPMRFPFAIPVKSGQSRWDVTWTWKAIADFSQPYPYAIWNNVQILLAMFKSAPFVEVASEHIRQFINPATLNEGATEHDTMAFALRQMRVDTVPDLSDTLQVTMTMSLFNFRPYSVNFQYGDGTGNAASSALTSNPFLGYLQTWINNNLDSEPTGDLVSTVDWEDQTPGSLTMVWREYKYAALPYPLTQPNGTTVNPANPGATAPGSSTQNTQTGYYPNNVIINPISPSNPDMQYWITALSTPESVGSGGYNAVNYSTLTNSGQPSVAAGLLQWTRGAAIDAMKQSDSSLGTNFISTAVQTGYLQNSGSSSGYSWLPKSVSNSGSSDPVIAAYVSWMTNPPISGGATTLQNSMAMAWAIIRLNAVQGNVLNAWEASYYGQGKAFQSVSTSNNYFTKAVNSWKSNPGHGNDFNPATMPIPAPSPTPAASVPAVSTIPATSPSGFIPGTTIPDTPEIQYLLSQGWTVDYATEAAVFLYKEHTLTLADQEHGDTPRSTDLTNIDEDHFVYPTQISVVFLNNFAQMPLASYQYPTYQHLGPVSTMVSIGLLSNADIASGTDDYDEPEHTGLSLISGMTNMIEDQFQRLRNSWRRVESIHHMQAIGIKNQVLNLLGIRGLLTKELTTETVPDAANLVNAQFTAVQYENVFESVLPFQVSVVPNSASSVWLSTLRNGSINQFSSNGSLNTLYNLSQLMQAADQTPSSSPLLFAWMVGQSGSTLGNVISSLLPSTAMPVPPGAYNLAFATPISASQQTFLLKVMNESPAATGSLLAPLTAATQTGSFTDLYPTYAAQITSHSQMLWSDYFMIKNGVNPGIPDYAMLGSVSDTIDDQNQAMLASGAEAPIDQLYDLYVGYALQNNVGGLQSQMVQAQNAPQLQSVFSSVTAQVTPGALTINDDHGCYRDIGITTIAVGGVDATPASYFYDDNKTLLAPLRAQVAQLAQTTAASAQAFAQATPNVQDQFTVSTASFDLNSLQAIIANTKLASYTMSKAFPTFKLFLMEDHSDKPFFSYDNFYSWATVLDLEVIRYRDRPDTAIIKISDLMHLLDEHLYDQTVQGQWEKQLAAPTNIILNADEALAGPSGGVGAVSPAQTVGGELIWNGTNQFSQINPGGGDHKFPLRYFPLQTGTKIQVRMGFANNPDLLTPVFTGEVTQIEGDEVLTITAQSYMLELVIPTTDEIRTDGFSVDGQMNNIANAWYKAERDVQNGNFLNIPSSLFSIFNQAPAYGGGGEVGGIRFPYTITPGGGVIDVMSSMLKVSTAKHFGAWQYGAPTDPYLKGWSWQNAAASVLLMASNSPLTQGATGLEAGYDRSYENILIAHVFGLNGTASVTGTSLVRDWWYEKTGGYGAPYYHVPKDNNLTPWTLIQDIARKYPEFILAVKQYGFPYTADATLVFANPHDFYSSRWPMPGETQVTANSSNILFSEWWTSSGNAQFVGFCNNAGGQWANAVLTTYDKSINYTGDSATTLLGKIGTVLGGLNQSSIAGPVAGWLGLSPSAPPGATMRDITANQLSAHISGGGVGSFNNIMQLFANSIGSMASSILYSGSSQGIGHGVSPQQAAQALNQINTSYQNFVKQKTSGSQASILTDRMKPVRRYHLVTGDSIIHNGIAINEKYYNTVRILNQNIVANSAIPAQHQRTLNVDSFLVSKQNLDGDPRYINAYAQSFLRDELAKAYRGELILLGNPEIEPFDVIMMIDPSTGISGPIEVESVIHSFNMENGFITIVRPRAFVVINDKLSASLASATWQVLTDIQGQVNGVSSKLGINAPLAEVGLGVAAVAGGIAVGPWIAGLTVLGGTMGLFWLGKQGQQLNPMGIVPLTRFDRPWIGGLEGWKIEDFIAYVNTQWQYFMNTEIEPLVESFRTARGMQLI